MNAKKLRAKMVEHGDSQKMLAERLGISAQTLSAKINRNDREFAQCEILLIANEYELTPAEIQEIFFNEFVS